MQISKHIDPAGTKLNQRLPSGNKPTVAVIIPVFNQARFLADAIESVMAQTRPADEIIVVDDGSTDDSSSIAAQFQNVRLIRQDNRGLSAARNTGLRNCETSHVVFLDSDDRLLPTAIEAGLACIADKPECAFVYGGYHLISEDGRRIGPDTVNPTDEDSHLTFLRYNPVSVPSMALFRRDCLVAINGFDETLRRVEDYDLYLRLTQRYPIAGHSVIVAEYRRHGRNMSSNLRKQYLVGRTVLQRYKARIASDAAAVAAVERRLVSRRDEYAEGMFYAAAAAWRTRQGIGKVLLSLAQAVQTSPLASMRFLYGALVRRIVGRVFGLLPDSIVRQLHYFRIHRRLPSVRDPKTFSEYVIQKIAFDRDPLLALTADKFAVRDYVKEKCGEDILIPLLQVVDRVEDINFDRLPDKFVLKATHASRLVEIVRDKSSVNKDELLARLSSWLKLNYYKGGCEWHYKNIPPRIVVEEALLDINNEPPPDYKFFVFRGKVCVIDVIVGRFVQLRCSFFDRDWKRLNVRYEQFPSAGDQPRPSKLDEMISIAEKLGEDFLFARIDLYQHEGRVYFGEITQTPSAGIEAFSPPEFDRALGEMLRTGAPVPACYYVEE
ncbi:MAG TPA: ATP-grasp fold amidoligase family protein [Blastocatellia bacterium]|nr:ATP-grasp fold amidoligase family protein [Blastocatellia bacterium]